MIGLLPCRSLIRLYEMSLSVFYFTLGLDVHAAMQVIRTYSTNYCFISVLILLRYQISHDTCSYMFVVKAGLYLL